jgi:hypothetical protein
MNEGHTEIKSPKPISADGTVKRMEDLLAATEDKIGENEKTSDVTAGVASAEVQDHKMDNVSGAKPAGLPYLVPTETQSSEDFESNTPVPAKQNSGPEPDFDAGAEADDEKPTPGINKGKQRASTFQDPVDQVEELMREWTVTK